MLNKSNYTLVFVLLILLIFIDACTENRTDDPDMKAYIETLTKERKEKDYNL
jgi:hypothetical protein